MAKLLTCLRCGKPRPPGGRKRGVNDDGEAGTSRRRRRRKRHRSALSDRNKRLSAVLLRECSVVMYCIYLTCVLIVIAMSAVLTYI